MPSTPPLAPRAFDVAAAHYLAHESALPDRFRYDAVPNLWRRHVGERWAPSDFGSALPAAIDTLHAALSAPEIPLTFRCVFAPVFAPYGALEAPVLTVSDLEAVTSWDDARARLADRYRARGWSPPPRASLIARRQRERLLRAVNGHSVGRALILASGADEFRYRPSEDSEAFDERSWLAGLRQPGARVRTSALYTAYLDTVPPGARRLDERRLHALAREVLGPSQRRNPGHHFYLDVALPEVEDIAPPRLRLVSGDG